MIRSYAELTERLKQVASSRNIRMQTLGEFGAGGKAYPLFLMHLGEPGEGKRGVTISAGIHGDEPAGVEAAIRFMDECGDDVDMLSKFYIVVFPCDNPSGYELGIRENADGIDLNRQFAARRPVAEVGLMMAALYGLCFDVVVELHEDIDAPGFYLYELAESKESRVGDKIVAAVAAEGYPINTDSCIEGLPAEEGVIRPIKKRFRKTHLPKAVYTYLTCGGHVLTLEPPAAHLPLEDRIKIELMALRIVLAAHK